MTSQSPGNSSHVDVSVVIPCVKAPLISTTLDSLRRQQSRFNYEVLVVGMDESGKVRSRNDIHFIETTIPLSAGANRNLGIRKARGRYILFTDADCEIRPGWIDMMAGRLEEGYRMVGGAFDFPRTKYWATGDNIAILHRLSPETPAGEVQTGVGGGNMGLWKEVLEELGGFDETFRGGQDNDLAIKLLYAGYTIYFEPRSVVVHLPEEGHFLWLCRHALIYGNAAVALVERHPEYFNIETILPLWRRRFAFLLWSPVRACIQATKPFIENRSYRRHLHVWPAVWCFHFLRRYAMFRAIPGLLSHVEE